MKGHSGAGGGGDRPGARRRRDGCGRPGDPGPRPGSPRIGGFSLVEILVALVLLGLGLTGTTATLLLASRIQARAWREGELVQRAGEVADSLVAVGGGTGEMEVPGGLLRWTVPAQGWGRVEAFGVGGAGEPMAILEVHP